MELFLQSVFLLKTHCVSLRLDKHAECSSFLMKTFAKLFFYFLFFLIFCNLHCLHPYLHSPVFFSFSAFSWRTATFLGPLWPTAFHKAPLIFSDCYRLQKKQFYQLDSYSEETNTLLSAKVRRLIDVTWDICFAPAPLSALSWFGSVGKMWRHIFWCTNQEWTILKTSNLIITHKIRFGCLVTDI